MTTNAATETAAATTTALLADTTTSVAEMATTELLGNSDAGEITTTLLSTAGADTDYGSYDNPGDYGTADTGDYGAGGHDLYGGDYNDTDDYNYNYEEYDLFIYPGYSFERPVYMYVWGILVIITFFANILVISVLLRKKMRNPTNMILAAIAISDSLTGLVTLPTYWAVYSKFQPAMNYSYHDYNLSYPDASPLEATTVSGGAADLNLTATTTENYYAYSAEYQDGYFLSQTLCRSFMISKYFLSKTFHTVSIWLTLFLGFQRFISVASPFRAQKIFCPRNVVIICVVIAVAAPVLHVYHLVNEKADPSGGLCQWAVEEPCKGTCVYLVTAFLLRHFIPCVLLVIFTVLFILQLAKSSSRLSRVDSNRGNAAMKHRDAENHRISLIVTLIVVVFLIPELPYGGFLLYALIGKLEKMNYDLETNRAIHLAYEVSLVLSFHANFYIYTFFNKRFRKGLLKGIIFPVLTCFGRKNIFGLNTTLSRSSFTSGGSRRRTLQSETGTRIELNNIRRSSSSATRPSNVTEVSTFVNGTHATNGANGANGATHVDAGDEKSQCLPGGGDEKL